MTIRFIIVLCLLLPVSTAWANTRIALVVGNSNYKIWRLTNPKNDAQDVTQQLRQLGFKVELVLDANRTNLHRAVQRFRSQLSGKTEVALMFYAGHGAQYGEQSYLLPLHANIKHASDLSIEALRATDVLAQMRATGSL